MPLRAVVFDFDGVIVDSEPLHFRALRDALAPDGVRITEEEYWSTYLAYDDREAIRLAFERHGGGAAPPERLAAAADRKVEAFARLIPEIPVFPGARELVRALAADGVPLAIASGARHAEIEAILAGIGLGDAFATVVGAEDAPRTKPDPAPYVEAAHRLAKDGPLAPRDCAAVEDSVPGILSAKGAGMRVVGVAHSYAAARLRPADRVVPSLVGLGPADFSALFES